MSEITNERAAREVRALKPNAAQSVPGCPVKDASKPSQEGRTTPTVAAPVAVKMHYPDGFITMSLHERIDAAIERIATGQAAMRIPAEQTDPDIVLAECKQLINALRRQRGEKP